MPSGNVFNIGYNARDAKWLLFSLVAIEVVFLIFFVTLHIIFPDRALGPLPSWFDLDNDISIPSWFSAVQLYTAALVLLLIVREGVQHRWFIALSAVVILFLSLDEGAGIHESISAFARNYNIEKLQAVMVNDHGAWVVPYLLAGVAFVICCLRPIIDIAQKFPKPSLYVIAGGLLVILGAVGLEMSSYLFLRDGAELHWYKAEVAGEEFLEQLGVSVVLYGILVYGLELNKKNALGAAGAR